MKLLFQLLSVSDRYERRARLLPGLIVAAPVTLTIGTLAVDKLPWYSTLGLTAGTELVIAFLLAYLARATGKVIEDALWKKWDGPPTTRWLRPDDTTCSEQQKSRWRGVIKRVANITIPATVTAKNDKNEIDRQITDAVRQLRYRLRDQPESKLVQIHNEEYGQARNLCGLRWYWVGISTITLIACITLLLMRQQAWAGLFISGVSLAIALLLAKLLPDLVKRCADRYAESLFAAAVAYDEREKSQNVATETPATSSSKPNH